MRTSDTLHWWLSLCSIDLPATSGGRTLSYSHFAGRAPLRSESWRTRSRYGPETVVRRTRGSPTSARRTRRSALILCSRCRRPFGVAVFGVQPSIPDLSTAWTTCTGVLATLRLSFDRVDLD